MDPFSEIKPALSQDQALAEANRCLMCFDAPCTRACPTHIDVPAFIKKIGTGNLRGSARTILTANILGASCARVCPTEVLCEGACVLHGLSARPIDIGRLQRHATDWFEGRSERLFAPAPRVTDQRVAVVGGGPAGLACAAELSRLGVGATVFEAALRPGGLNTYGVAEYKMTAATALREIAWVEQHGVEVRCGITVGRELPIERLERDFAAVFLGVGLGPIAPLGIPGEALPGVGDALDFIARLKTDRRATRIGRRVVVVGGGNTAIDAVTQAQRLGAEEVWLAYRRGRAEMSAYAHEVELATRSGCRFLFHVAPSRVVGESGVQGIALVRTRSAEPAPGTGPGTTKANAPATGAGNAAGKAPLELVPGSEFVVPCDTLLKATGQQIRRAFFESLPGVRLDRGLPIVDADYRTTNPRWFSAGDCRSGGKEVVNAVAEGKVAAQAIARQLTAAAGRS